MENVRERRESILDGTVKDENSYEVAFELRHQG